MNSLALLSVDDLIASGAASDKSDSEKVASKNPDLKDFFSLSQKDLENYLAELSAQTGYKYPKFRASQLIEWVYQKGVTDPNQWSNIAKVEREQFLKLFYFPKAIIKDRQISVDGTRKYLFEVENGDAVEAVMIKQPKRMTLCVSSQVGCGMNCQFCRTATMGFRRNLSTSEIMRQVLGVIEDAKQFNDSFSNIVFMGMGEPLHNVDNVIRALNILTDHKGLAIPSRKITVSTVGLVPAIKKFGDSMAPANLAVSLNATTDEVRSSIMPINKRFNIETLLGTLRQFPLKGRKRITIEYVMLHGVNDSTADLKRLPKLLRGIPSKVNLIPYNENAGLGFKSPPRDHVDRWQKELNTLDIDVTIRWSKGQDISAACGQLATASGRR
jgi:23S rRNA (adenine2503-C2)-methyltransferase